MSWKLNDTKNFRKNFHDVLETGIRVEIKRLIFFHEQIKFELAPKKKWFVALEFLPTNKGRVCTWSGKSGNLLEDQGKVSGENFYLCKF